MPDIFDDLDTFQQWFDFQDMKQGGNSEFLAQGEIVTQLHNILKPFLLRRLKTEVEQNLPPKKEYLLYAPLTQQQNDIYKAIVNHEIRDYLIAKKIADGGADLEDDSNDVSAATSETEAEESGNRSSRRLAKRARFDYSRDSNDKDFLEGIESGDASKMNMTAPKIEKTARQLGQEWAVKEASTLLPSRTSTKRTYDAYLDYRLLLDKTVNNMKLQNMIMQLRKVSRFCLKQAYDIAIERQLLAQISSHPFLFDWPRDQDTGDLIVDDNLVNASGKMLLLQRLLDALFERGHKVLIFSQFTTMLDVIVRHSRPSSAR
jgi:ATP-dependent DNA helicase